jgi:hypothetical protein
MPQRSKRHEFSFISFSKLNSSTSVAAVADYQPCLRRDDVALIVFPRGLCNHSRIRTSNRLLKILTARQRTQDLEPLIFAHI